MSLSQKTINNLADVLKDEAITYIQYSEEYADFMIDIIHEFLTLKVGEMDQNLKSEIAFEILENIHLE